MSSKFPKLQMHRGYWKSGVRENTLQAFIAAKRLGADMAELDVQLSKEKVPVVYHDESLKRIFHIDDLVTRTSVDDLKALNIPLLSQVLKNEDVPKNLNIELKIKTLNCLALVRQVIKEAQKNHKKNIMISSFNPVCLFWMKLLAPKLPRALIIHKKTLVKSFNFKIYMLLSSPEFLNVHYEIIDDTSTRDRIIHEKKPVIVWTVNETNKALFYLRRGAVGIISDEPLKLP